MNESQNWREKVKVGDRVIKNEETWVPNDFDSWGRGEGVGVVVESPIPLNDDEVDVRWPGGRCFEHTIELLPWKPVSWHEFCVLIGLNYWPMEGMPVDYVAVQASGGSEGDYRGVITVEEAQAAFQKLLDNGWARVGESSDGTSREFAYPTEEGQKIFENNKEYWTGEWKRLRDKAKCEFDPTQDWKKLKSKLGG